MVTVEHDRAAAKSGTAALGALLIEESDVARVATPSMWAGINAVVVGNVNQQLVNSIGSVNGDILVAVLILLTERTVEGDIGRTVRQVYIRHELIQC